ncbi:MAG: lipoyl synthase [Acidimicrobiia bacterium]|nr:lipoyl synthase [Acidimicrobiia bacterium]
MRSRWLGRLPYGEAWDLQRAFHEGRVEGRTDDDYLLLLEHPPTYTIGRNGDGSNLLITPEVLDDFGAELFHVDRGGDITFHGPGQLVGYPIVQLPDSKQIVPYVRRLEQVIIDTLGELGIEAWPEEGLTGVWTSAGKVAAIGVRVSRGVTMHGFAINLDPDMRFFDHINPCGLLRPVTSVSALLGRKVSHEEVIDLLVPRFAELFTATFVDDQRAAFARGTGREFDVDQRVAAGTFSDEPRTEPVLVRGRLAGEPERPEWMRVKAVMNDGYREMKNLMRSQELNTVCEEAGCPNIFECWASGTATLMLLGDTCTRACSFCDVKTGKPGEVDIFEPMRAADAVASMGLSHAVLTSVNRDDLADGGSGIFAQTIREIRRKLPECDVEVLIPDFKGDRDALETVMEAEPAVLNHNTETVLRLQRDIRTAANYGRSLALLARAKWINPEGYVKSGLIVGMGETEEEVLATLADLRAVGVDIVTIGQYLRPSSRHRPIDRYVHPDEFNRYTAEGERLGFGNVYSGPLVRSSYHAREAVGAAAK